MTASDRLAFVTNFCPHYRKPLFEALGRRHDVDFLFFSQSGERYWNWALTPEKGSRFRYLKGFSLAGLRIVPSLYRLLLTRPYDAVLKCTNGKLELIGTYLIARLRGKPFVLWHTYWQDPAVPGAALARRIAGHIQRTSNAIVVIGPHIKEFLVRRGVPADKIFIAWQATDNELYRAEVTPEAREVTRLDLNVVGRRVILFVGRFEPAKGLDCLVDAVAALNRPDATVVFVGAGDMKQELTRRCGDRKVDCRFVATVPPAEIRRYYAIADVFVLPSVRTRTFLEPWGLVLNEAMNQRVPVVATDAVGAAAGGLVRDGETGLVVQAGSPPALATALGRLLDDRELARRLGDAGFKEVLAFNYDRMLAGFEAALAHARTGYPGE